MSTEPSAIALLTELSRNMRETANTRGNTRNEQHEAWRLQKYADRLDAVLAQLETETAEEEIGQTRQSTIEAARDTRQDLDAIALQTADDITLGDIRARTEVKSHVLKALRRVEVGRLPGEFGPREAFEAAAAGDTPPPPPQIDLKEIHAITQGMRRTVKASREFSGKIDWSYVEGWAEQLEAASLRPTSEGKPAGPPKREQQP